MRLTPQQIDTIKATVHIVLGAYARVSLFGSRLDDQRRGGNVDLLVEAEHEPGLLQRASLKNQLESTLQLPVDIVAASFTRPSAFARMAKAQALPLQGLTA
jgi:predicted nucleotidyltransferase